MEPFNVLRAAYITPALPLFRPPITLATTPSKQTALTCSIYTPTQALASGAYNPPVKP